MDGDHNRRFPPPHRQGGTKRKACAVCKFQSKRCTPECVFAPYFPAEQPKAFMNVHRLFGVNNVKEMLRNLHPSQHKRAMDAIIGEAYYRDRYPVGGCWEEICRLHYENRCLKNEIRAVQQELDICGQHHGSSSSMVNNVITTSQLDMGMMTTPRNNLAFPLFIHNNRPIIKPETYKVSLHAVSDQQSYCNANSTVGYNNSMDVQFGDHVVVAPNTLWAHQQNPCPDDGGDSMAMAMHSQSQLVSTPSQTLDMEQNVVGEYDVYMNSICFDVIDGKI